MSESRKATFKQAIVGGTDKRAEKQSQLRKAKQASAIRKRRITADDDSLPPTAEAIATAAAATPQPAALTGALSAAPEVRDIPLPSYEQLIAAGVPHAAAAAAFADVQFVNVYAAALSATDVSTILWGATKIRKLMSIVGGPPVTQVIASGALPRLAAMLRCDGMPQLQFEALWSLTNVASTAHTHHVVECGVVPLLPALLRSADLRVVEQSAWIVGNIVGDSFDMRAMVVQQPGMVEAMSNALVSISPHVEKLRNVAWACSALLRECNRFDMGTFGTLPLRIISLVNHHDLAVVSDVLWGCSYISSRTTGYTEALVTAGILPRVAAILRGALEASADSPLYQCGSPAIRVLGNCVSSTDAATQAAIDVGIIALAKRGLEDPRRMVRKDSLWIFANLAAATPEQRAFVVEDRRLLAHVVETCFSDDWEISKEATWVLCNSIKLSPQCIPIIGESRGFDAIIKMLDKRDFSILPVALDAINAALEYTETAGGYPLREKLLELDAVETLTNLQSCENDDVYAKSKMILVNFFGGVEEGEDDATLEDPENHDTFMSPAAAPAPTASSAAGPGAYQAAPAGDAPSCGAPIAWAHTTYPAAQSSFGSQFGSQ